MNKNDKPIYPIRMVAWATPIHARDSKGRIKAMEFFNELPKPPDTNAMFTFLDEKGRVVPAPSFTDQNLPPYCFVQYVENLPPPPPLGYRYLKSELQRNMRSPEYHFYHEVGSPRYGVDTPNVMGFIPFELTLQQRSGMESTLVALEEGYFSTEAGILISNFIIVPHSIVRIHGMSGPVIEKLQYSVKAQGKTVLPNAECNVELLDRLPEYIRGKVAGCLINVNASRVDAQIVFHLRSGLLHLPRTEKYCSSGWHKLSGNWYYVQDNIDLSRTGIEFKTNFKIAQNHSLSACAAMNSAMGMLAISEKLEVIVPMVLYAHLGVLFTLFECAGFPPRMLLFVNGKTGSLKTAVCGLLYNLTGDAKRNIPATFRDSVASVEAKFADYADKVFLLDDYSPATTARNRADMNKLLEDIIRYYGDGKGRGRSNATVTKAVTPVPRGLCCITGEDTGGSQSSLLRCVLVDVANGTFNGKLLAPYQSDPSLWTTHFEYFLQYVAKGFNEMVTEIQRLVPILRDEFRKSLSAGRSVDSAVYLCITARLLLDYGVSVGWATADEALNWLNLWCNAVVEAVKSSENISSELDPVHFYLSTLFEAVDSGTECIANDKELFLLDPSVLGYVHEGYWHLWPDKVYSLVVKRAQLQRKLFPLSIVKTHSALSDAHLIDVTEERRRDKVQVNYLRRESFGERPRMLVLNKEAAQSYLES